MAIPTEAWQEWCSRRKPAVIVDMDGTLSSCEWRRHHVNDGKREWAAFFEKQSADAPVPAVVNRIDQAKADGCSVIVVTARPDIYRYQTEWWLMLNRIEYDFLFMRDRHDHRPDAEVKRDLYRAHIVDDFDAQFALEDRPQVAEVWASFDIPVVLVEDPDLEPIFMEPPADVHPEYHIVPDGERWGEGDDPIGIFCPECDDVFDKPRFMLGASRGVCPSCLQSCWRWRYRG